MPKLVPNLQPSLRHPHCRLAVVGEAPGQDEDYTGEPFVGSSGKVLFHILGRLNLAREQVFVGNVCQQRPLNNDLDAFPWFGEEIQGGLAQLRADLETFQPNLVLLLGKSAFKAFFPSREPWSVDSHRGSLRLSEDILPGIKTLVTYHPAYILRVWQEMPLFKSDLQRAVEESKTSGLVLPERHITTRPTFFEAQAYIQDILTNKTLTAFDVEGYNDNVGVTMFSIATSPTRCMVFPLYLEGHHYWSVEEESALWQLVATWLSDPKCGKIVTNAMYELFIMAWKHSIVIQGIYHDTMFAQWELFPELPKSLATQVSLFTREPYYKDERLSNDTDTRLLYNGKDSACSFEVCTGQLQSLNRLPRSLDHYDFNLSLIPAIGYLQLRGVKLSLERAQDHILQTSQRLSELQVKIDEQVLSHAVAAGVVTRKRKSDPYHFNFKSSVQKAWLLYDYLGYKPYERFGRTSKEEILLRYYAKHRDPLLRLLIDGVFCRTRISDVEKLLPDSDQRIRSNFNLVGTDTGRLSSSESNSMAAFAKPSGALEWVNTGTNLQNVTKELRDCFVPDSENFYFFECDLSGADGWTVAADLAALGYPTMLDDYMAGIKPAKVLLLLLAEHEAGRDPRKVNSLDRATLMGLCRQISFPKDRDPQGRPGDWKYLCMKRVQHGTNYGMQPGLLSATIFKDSEGLIDLTEQQAAIYQSLYKLRYNPDARNRHIETTLRSKGGLQSAAGIYRRFYAIRNSVVDPNTLRSALSFEPQANTTYVTNCALRNLWFDPENRRSNGSLFVEPLLLIHDALAGQFPKTLLPWATKKIKQWFQNEITIAGQKILIPFEGHYGSSWRNYEGEF